MEDLQIELRKLAIADGETVVLTCSRRLSGEQASAIRDAWTRANVNAQLIVLDDGMKLETWSEERLRELRSRITRLLMPEPSP